MTPKKFNSSVDSGFSRNHNKLIEVPVVGRYLFILSVAVEDTGVALGHVHPRYALVPEVGDCVLGDFGAARDVQFCKGGATSGQVDD